MDAGNFSFWALELPAILPAKLTAVYRPTFGPFALLPSLAFRTEWSELNVGKVEVDPDPPESPSFVLQVELVEAEWSEFELSESFWGKFELCKVELGTEAAEIRA
jgi:hypothetical protein